MPKESVRDASTVGKLAMVGWTPGGEDHDGTVQLAAINSNVQLTPTLVYDEHGTPHKPVDPGTIDGWWIDLDLPGINRMIRLLRRARDKAYGTDA